MTRTPCSFFDPNTSTTYNWPVNFSSEDAFGKSRSIQRTANTGLVGLVKQQSDDGPLLMTVKGTIFQTAHLQAFWGWYELSKNQTVHFTDYAGNSYEVQVVAFVPTREPVVRNPREPSLLHIWKYEMTMEIYSILAGDLFGAGVSV